MTDNNFQQDINNITLKCLGLKFPAFHVRTEVGPKVVTHYFRPATGSSAPLSNILNKSNDIAFSCGVKTCVITRIRNEIAIAIPIEDPKTIGFYDAVSWLMTNKAAMSNMAIPLLMGQKPTGEYYAIDLATQPHLLIAGSTGSGKSVFTAELLLALGILKKPKTELDMFLVDTKQLDFTPFAGLPHVRSIVTDVRVLHQVLDSLMRLVRKRTETMKGFARNVFEWNKLVKPYHPEEIMAFKLLVIDELADVMDSDRGLGITKSQRLGKGEEEGKGSIYVETISAKLKSLTQISRAAGVHVIAATQRPSVQVIGGDIKANFPARLSFRLPTGTDSRVILGEVGAENLLGKGDYLFASSEDSDLQRGHGAFVELADITSVIAQTQDIRKTMEEVNVL